MNRLALAAGLALLAAARADEAPPPGRTSIQTQIPDAAAQPDGAASTDGRGKWEVIQSLWVFGTVILAFTGLMLWGVFQTMQKAGKGWDDWNSFRLVVVIFGIGVSGFLVVAGYSSNQMAGVIGLLGAIIGYVFGKGDDSKPGAPPAASPLPPPPRA